MTYNALQIGFPWAAALLVLLIPSFIIGRRRLAFSGRTRRFLVLSLQMLVFILLIVSLMDPRWLNPSTAKATVFLIDSSSSTAGFQGAAAGWVRQAMEKMGPDDRAAVVAFGRTPKVLQPLGKTRDFRAANLPIDDRSDLAAALALGQSLLPPSGVRRIVVLSDGWENMERAEDVSDALAAANIVVDVVKPTAPRTGIAVRSVDAPQQVRDGDPFDTFIQIETVTDGQGQLAITLDGQPATRQAVDLKAGMNQYTIPMTAAGEGFHRLAVQVSQGEAVAPVSEGYFIVKPRGNVLLLEDRAGEAAPLAQVLQQAGLRTEIRQTSSIPANAAPLRAFDAIGLVNVAATSMTLDQQKTLQTFVRVYGKGLVVVGGPNSYTLGDYGSNLLGEMLPVNSDIPPKPEEGKFGLLLVIDKSGSMDLRTDGVTKMQMAKEAAILAVDMLRDDDIIGIVVFDTNSRWLVEPQQVSDNRGVPAIQARITGVQADGGTEILPALERGLQGLKQTDARYKHIVLLSDGESPGEFDTFLNEVKASRITMSAIAVGSDADTDTMSKLARDGGGRYYFTEKIRDVPRIMAKETSIAIGATTAQGKVQPQFIAPSPVLRSLVPADLPTLQTYAVTIPRDAAETILVSPSGDPLLAQWQYGNGRTVAWTSSFNPDWGGDWNTWPQAPQFWGQLVRYAMGIPSEPGLNIQTSTQADIATITADAVNDDGSFLDLASAEAVIIGPDNQAVSVPLRQQAPGQYAVTVQAVQPGAHEVRVTLSKSGLPDRTETSGFVAVLDPESRSLTPNNRLLNRLAGVTGGQQLADPAAAFADGPKPSGLAFQPLWQWFLGAALILFPFEIASRRLGGIRLRRRRT